MVTGMMAAVTNLHEGLIPGYGSGPLAHLPELLDEPLFWLAHLCACARSEEAQELLFGADYDAAQDFHRLLLLLPALGDADLPVEAPTRLVAALSSLTAIEDPERLAAALLADQGPCGPARWTTTRNGLRINDGAYSYRNPANAFALPADRLAHVTASLTL